MPSPLTSGAALIHAATLTGNLDGGWGYYEALKDNGALAGGGNGDVLKSVAGGEKLYGIIVDYMPIREKAKGAPSNSSSRRKASRRSPSRSRSSRPRNLRGREGLRRFPAFARGTGTGAEAGLHPGASRRRAAGRLSAARQDQGYGLRRRKGPRRRDEEQDDLRRHLRPVKERPGSGPLADRARRRPSPCRRPSDGPRPRRPAGRAARRRGARAGRRFLPARAVETVTARASLRAAFNSSKPPPSRPSSPSSSAPSWPSSSAPPICAGAASPPSPSCSRRWCRRRSWRSPS